MINRARCDLLGRSVPGSPPCRPQSVTACQPLFLGALALLPTVAQAAPATLDRGDTAWMLTSTALVLLMTLPGLALFNAGMVRAKNVLSVMAQCLAIVVVVSVLWVLYGCSLAFDSTGMVPGAVDLHAFIGGLGKVGLVAVGRNALVGSIPETV